jgi:hypothetical protein
VVELGRHAILRGWWGDSCGFKSRLRHHIDLKKRNLKGLRFFCFGRVWLGCLEKGQGQPEAGRQPYFLVPEVAGQKVARGFEPINMIEA